MIDRTQTVIRMLLVSGLALGAWAQETKSEPQKESKPGPVQRTLGKVGKALDTAADKTVDGTKTAAGATASGAKTAAGATATGAKTAAGATADATKTAAGKTADATKTAAGATAGATKTAAGKTADTSELGARTAVGATGSGINKVGGAMRSVGVLDINTATEKELEGLPGIGDAYAQKIVQGRPYKAKDDLVHRQILPASVYDKVKNRIVARQIKN
jgi:DNA uptake protein ComE-like DNA-binding protein